MRSELLCKLLFSAILGIGLFLIAPGCRKDHSYEGGSAADTTKEPPVLPPAPVVNKIPYYCIDCVGHDKVEMGRWSFKIDTSLFCGYITASPITPERVAFTFFGPSACSPDSGLIMTVYLNGIPLNTDKQNMITNKVAMEYYDNVTGPDILYSRTITEMSLTIESYIHQTKIASGFFSGTVYNSSDKPVIIKDGKFKIQFPK